MKRRLFLASSKALVALPMFSSYANKSNQQQPKRIVFIGMGYGVTKEYWYPDTKQVGSDWELPIALKPLEKHKEDLTIIQNLYHKNTRNAHAGSTFWLTGADQFGKPGKSFHNTISVDQVMAQHYGQFTRFNSLQMDAGPMNGTADGHGSCLSLAWNAQGKPLASTKNPLTAYHRLFSSDGVSLEERRENLLDQKSLLDTVTSDIGSIKKNLNRDDQHKLEEYVESIRDIEKRISKEESWLEIPRKIPKEPMAEPSDSLVGSNKAIKVIYDLIAMALEVDASRVISTRLPVAALIKSLGATISGHDMSHYNPGPKREVSKKRDIENAKLLSHFLSKLKNTQCQDGSSLFDHTTIVFGSNLSNVHSLRNCPTIIAGHGSNFKQGQHIVMKEETPLCNLWLTTLKAHGFNHSKFGDSKGTIDELI